MISPFFRLALACTAAAALTAACSSGGQQPAAERHSPATSGKSGHPASSSPSASPSAAPVDPASVHANELGRVPVLMIHQVKANPSGGYDQSPEEFRATLEMLAQQGYVPITAADFVAGKIDVPAGKSPVVLTLDDGTSSQFKLLPDGSVDPTTAIGILLDVAKKYPGFRPVATMYVNSDPFGTKDYAPLLKWLVDHGFEIGNHTYSHANLKKLDATGVQMEWAKEAQVISTALPGYQVSTEALPFGVSAQDKALDMAGSWNGISYSFKGVMLVGSNPAPSPYSSDFKPAAIPRIRSEHGSVDQDEHTWLPELASGKSTRYVSDGNPATISFPKAEADKLAPALTSQARPY